MAGAGRWVGTPTRPLVGIRGVRLYTWVGGQLWIVGALLWVWMAGMGRARSGSWVRVGFATRARALVGGWPLTVGGLCEVRTLARTKRIQSTGRVKYPAGWLSCREVKWQAWWGALFAVEPTHSVVTKSRHCRHRG